MGPGDSLHRATPPCSLDAQQDHPEGHRELQNHARAEGISADIEDKIIMIQDTFTYYAWIGAHVIMAIKSEQREQRCKLACNLCRVARKEGESQFGLNRSMHQGKEKSQLSRSQDCAISQESTADRDPR